MEPRIIFEDEWIVVIDKPSGVVVNRAESVSGLTVQDWVERRTAGGNLSGLPETPDEVFVGRAGIVHRLDKETSGLLIIAKTPAVFANLQNQFKTRVVKKSYIALVHGEVKEGDGEIGLKVGRLPWNRERFGVLEDGRDAQTGFRVLKRFIHNAGIAAKRTHPGYDFGYTLLELFPKTGRTHQIRVHLKSMGHPVVADEFYAGRKTSREDRAWCPRLFLHATRIEFKHPVSQRIVILESLLPTDLVDALKDVAHDSDIANAVQ